MATIDLTREQFNEAINSMCDALKTKDLIPNLKSSAGMAITTSLCDAYGHATFSYDTVLKYSKDEYGIEKITASVAGKLVGDYVFDKGIDVTIRTALGASSAVAWDTAPNPLAPIFGGVAGVGIATTGFAISKAAQNVAESTVSSFVESLLTKDKDKIDSSNNKTTLVSDTSYEVWTNNNGLFTQTVKIDNSSNQILNSSVLIKEEKNIYDYWKNNLISDSFYSDISETITNNLIYSSVYKPTFDNFFYSPSLNPIGAFYESTTNKIDNSTSIANKTYVLLNSSNQSISKSQLESLDLNKDGKLNGSEILNLKTWKDLNEDGIAQVNEITSLNETIYSKDYDTYTIGNSKFQNQTTLTTPVKQSVSYTTPTSNYVSVSIVPYSDKNKKVSFIKSKNTVRFYQANLGKVA